MAPSTLYRLSGLALLVALPVSLVGHIGHPPGHDLVYLVTPVRVFSHATVAVAWTLLLLGLPGLYVRQADRAGTLGLVGFALMAVFCTLRVSDMLYEAFLVPVVARDPAAALVAPGGPLSFQVSGALPGGFALAAVVAFGAGLCFGAATIRAGVLPRWAGVWPIVGVLLLMLTAPWPHPTDVLGVEWVHLLAGLGFTATFLGFAWGGYGLWAADWRPERAPRAPAPHPAT